MALSPAASLVLGAFADKNSPPDCFVRPSGEPRLTPPGL
jgi:hypothetical protein